jgi:hypothetical protein
MRNREASMGDLPNHLYRLGADIESFINGEASLDSITEKSISLKQELAAKGEGGN